MSSVVELAPRVVIFAGSNGAGKSIHADAILAALGIETFVNADYIGSTWLKLQKLSNPV